MMKAKMNFFILLLLAATGRLFSQESPAHSTQEKTGCISGNCENGYGVKVFATGARYEGTWTAGSLNGKCKEHWANGESYEGDFIMNKWEGQGTYISASGEKYVGQWKSYLRDGMGIQYNADGSVNYDGLWKEGKHFVVAEKKVVEPVDEPVNKPRSNRTDKETEDLMASLMIPMVDYDEEFGLDVNRIFNEYPNNFQKLKGEKKLYEDNSEYWLSNKTLHFTVGDNQIYIGTKTYTMVWAGYFYIGENKDEALKKYNEMAGKISKVKIDCCKMTKVEKNSEDLNKLTGWMVDAVNTGKSERLKEAGIKLFYISPGEDFKKYRVGILIENMLED